MFAESLAADNKKPAPPPPPPPPAVDQNVVMIGAKDVRITWGEDSSHWKWTADSAVGELLNVWWFDVSAKVDMGTNRMLMTLPENASYGAYFLYKLPSDAQGFGEDEGMEVVVGIQERNVSSTGVVYLQGSKSMSRERGDGWSEVKMGDFLTVGRNAEGAIADQDKYSVDLKLYNHMGTYKTGLIVYGFELRPN
ncbi:F-box protein PP2-B11 [Linum grandiflorum]